MVSCAIGLVFAASAPAEAETIKCRREIARQSSKFVQAKIKALARCEDQILTGKIAGPCPDAKAASQITKASTKLRSAIDQKCGGGDRSCGTGGDDDTLASLGFGGSCPNIQSGTCNGTLANCDDVADCVSCIDQSAIDQAIDLSTGAPAPNAEALGCQREIAKSLAKVVRAEAKAHGKCIDRVLKGGGGSCPDATALAGVARARSKFAAKVCQRKPTVLVVGEPSST